MTTLHGLVTISEFFAGFNLINTAVVNCLIMCQNASKMHNSEATNTKIFREGAGCAPSQTPLPMGEGVTPSPYPTPIPVVGLSCVPILRNPPELNSGCWDTWGHMFRDVQLNESDILAHPAGSQCDVLLQSSHVAPSSV